MDNIAYTKERFDSDIQEIIRQIRIEPVKFDQIIGIKRGGCIPAVCLSHALDVPLTILDIDKSKYNPFALEVTFYGFAYHYKNILVVDDIFDSGNTINNIKYTASKFHSLNTCFAVLLCNRDVPVPLPFYCGTSFSRQEEPRYFDFWWETYK